MTQEIHKTEDTPTYTPQQVKAVIHAQFPDITIDALRFCGEGSSFCSYAVNETYLYRFGANDESAERLRREECLLPQLRRQLNLAVPEFLFTGAMENGCPFVVYRMIQGEPFTEKVYEQLPSAAKERVVGQLADFLTALHTFPADKAAACLVREKPMLRSCREFREQAQRTIYPQFSAPERTTCERWFEQYARESAYHAYTPALIHGDLQPRHVFFEPNNQCIAGVIDFEDIWISDPDYELHYLLTEFGRPFGDQLVLRYGHASPERLRWKSRLFRLCRCIDEVVWGLEDNRPEAVKDGWRALKALLVDLATS